MLQCLSTRTFESFGANLHILRTLPPTDNIALGSMDLLVSDGHRPRLCFVDSVMVLSFVAILLLGATTGKA